MIFVFKIIFYRKNKIKDFIFYRSPPQNLVFNTTVITMFNITLKDNEDNEQYVLKAIQCGVDCLQYASNRLQGDKAIVSASIKCFSNSFKYASNEIKNDPKFIVRELKNNMYILPHISDKLKEDNEFILYILEKCRPKRLHFDFYIYVVSCIPDKLRKDEDFLLELFKIHAYFFKLLPITLRADRPIVIDAIKQRVDNLQYASDELINKESIILLSIKYSFCCRSWICQYTPYLGKTEPEWLCYFCDFYKKTQSELIIILRESKLTLSDAGAKLFTVNKEFDENTNSYIINMRAMDGNEYTISNIDSDITVNELANKLYHLDNSHNNIVFINENGDTFSLVNFNEKIINLI